MNLKYVFSAFFGIIALAISLIWMYDLPISGAQVGFAVFIFLLMLVVVFLMDRSENTSDDLSLKAIARCERYWNTLIQNKGDMHYEEITYSGMVSEWKQYLKAKRNKIYEQDCQVLTFEKKNDSKNLVVFIYSFDKDRVIKHYDNVPSKEKAEAIAREYYPYMDDGSRDAGSGGNVYIKTGNEQKGNKWDSPEDDNNGKENGETNIPPRT